MASSHLARPGATGRCLESHGVPGEIHVSETTCSLLDGRYAFSDSDVDHRQGQGRDDDLPVAHALIPDPTRSDHCASIGPTSGKPLNRAAFLGSMELMGRLSNP
jgi:hypothetical protein